MVDWKVAHINLSKSDGTWQAKWDPLDFKIPVLESKWTNLDEAVIELEAAVKKPPFKVPSLNQPTRIPSITISDTHRNHSITIQKYNEKGQWDGKGYWKYSIIKNSEVRPSGSVYRNVHSEIAFDTPTASHADAISAIGDMIPADRVANIQIHIGYILLSLLLISFFGRWIMQIMQLDYNTTIPRVIASIACRVIVKTCG